MITGWSSDLPVWARTYYSNVAGAPQSLSSTFLRHQLAVFLRTDVLFCVLVIVVVSLLPKPPHEKIQGWFSVIAAGTESRARQLNHWDIIHTVIILGITVAFYIYFCKNRG